MKLYKLQYYEAMTGNRKNAYVAASCKDEAEERFLLRDNVRFIDRCQAVASSDDKSNLNPYLP